MLASGRAKPLLLRSATAATLAHYHTIDKHEVKLATADFLLFFCRQLSLLVVWLLLGVS